MTSDLIIPKIVKPALPQNQRIMSLWFPQLPAQRVLRQRLGRSWRSTKLRPAPLAVSCRDANTQQIYALDEEAVALGLRIGLGIADARAMHPALDIVEQDLAADRRLIEALADWCDRYTPLVALDGTDGLFLDISGCAHLFGGECAMRDEILSRFFHQGFAATCAIASTPGAAWAAARFGGKAQPAGRAPPMIVSPGSEKEMISSMPPAALRLGEAVCAGLESVGLRSAGALLAAPRAPLARRFGREVLLRLDQALGGLEEAISPRLPVPLLSVERNFAEPILCLEDIEMLVLILAGALKYDLERRGEGARQLDLLLFRVDGDLVRIVLKTSRPLREPRLIHRLFRERLTAVGGTFDTQFGFDLVRLAAVAVGPIGAVQADLSGGTAQGLNDLAVFADRARARLGPAAVLGALPRGSHLPERAVVMRPLVETLAADGAEFSSGQERKKGGLAKTPKSLLHRAVGRPDRPIRLFTPPEPVNVTAAAVPEGPPSHFRWRRVAYAVSRAEGPERIAPEWWRAEKDAPPRDYFRVEDAAGHRFWLYREGLYGAGSSPRWYMHGLFA